MAKLEFDSPRRLPARGAGLSGCATSYRSTDVSTLGGLLPWRNTVSPAELACTLGELTGLQGAALRFARRDIGQVATPVTSEARSRAAECGMNWRCSRSEFLADEREKHHPIGAQRSRGARMNPAP